MTKKGSGSAWSACYNMLQLFTNMSQHAYPEIISKFHITPVIIISPTLKNRLLNPRIKFSWAPEV